MPETIRQVICTLYEGFAAGDYRMTTEEGARQLNWLFTLMLDKYPVDMNEAFSRGMCRCQAKEGISV